MNGWSRFSTGDSPSAVHIEILDGRFIRIRDRSRDRPGQNAYVVIDIQARRVLDDLTTFKPRKDRGSRKDAGHVR